MEKDEFIALCENFSLKEIFQCWTIFAGWNNCLMTIFNSKYDYLGFQGLKKNLVLQKSAIFVA